MKNIKLLSVLTLPVLVCTLFVSCAKTAAITSAQSTDPVTTEAPNTDSGKASENNSEINSETSSGDNSSTFFGNKADNYPFFPESDDRGHLFIEDTYDSHIISELLGDKYNEWSENRKNNGYNHYLPTVYEAITELKVSKEDFIKKNNEIKNKNKIVGSKGDITFSDEMIELFYSKDEKAIVKACMSPYTMYSDGKLYYFTDVLKLSDDELKALSVDKKEFKEYITISQNAMKNQNFWNDGYQSDFDKLLSFANGD